MKLTQMQIADNLFSKFILKRDKGICQKCRKPGNQNSHFYKRARFSVRFDPLNCVCLCPKDHAYFEVNPTLHKEWFKNHIGNDNFMKVNKSCISTITDT